MAYATDTLTALPFGAIIGGPMKAAVEAQALAARATIEFIEKVGFDPPEPEKPDPFSIEFESDPDKKTNSLGPVRNVTFTYESKKEDGTVDVVSLTVPILTIVPIPYIRIDELSINFIAKIQEQQVNTNTVSREVVESRSSSASFRAGWWWWGGSVNYNASVSSKQNSSATSASKYQTEYTMNVHLRAVQDDMPAGLSKVLSILEGGIKESREPKTVV
ncbi:MAG: DUF2589 domain-containing protein [Vicingaceae bacterium]